MKRFGRKKKPSQDDTQDDPEPVPEPEPEQEQEPEQEPEHEKEPETSGEPKPEPDENQEPQIAQEELHEEQEPGPSEEDADASSSQPQLRGQVEQFRPHRLSNQSFAPPRDNDEPENETEPEVQEVQQAHKPTASEYAMLEDADSIMYMKSGATLSQAERNTDAELDDVLSDMEMSGYIMSESMAQQSTRRPRWRKFKKYVYNSENNTYCSRTISGWCAICNYYFWIILIFLAVFMVYILTFIWRDTDSSPAFLKMTIMEHPNPALAIVPLAPDQSDMVIWYNSGRDGSAKLKKYKSDISNYLGKSDLACHQQKLLKQKCDFNLTDFGPCAEAPYGYDQKKPCIFLKLNNLLTWMPTPMSMQSGRPPGTSPDLWERIKKDHSQSARHCVYVDCQGATVYDEAYLGTIAYYPEPAFDIKFFPATRETTTNPTIAIKLDEIKAGHVLQIHCTLHAGNIKDKPNSNIKLTLYVE